MRASTKKRSDIAPQNTRDEFAAGWPVLLGAMLGIGVGIFAIPLPAISIFLRDLQTEFGWTRAQISLGPTILIATLAIISPFLGWIADRVSAVWISAFALSAQAIALLLLSRLSSDLWTYYAVLVAMAVMACGASTLIYARVISTNFVHGRGFALGLAMIGNGITWIILPILLVPYAERAGWRLGFVALAIVVALTVPIVAFLLSRGRIQIKAPKSIAITTTGALKTATSDPVFWTMVACFTLIPFAASGLQLHLFAFMADGGIDAVTAASIASLGGIGLIVGRVVTGWLIDRIFAPYVAAVIMMISAVCIAIIAFFGASAAPFGAIAVGLSLGSEIDLVGYMTARYFGMRAYGRIYGLLYAALLIGSASSPVVYGAIFDTTGSYMWALYGAAGVMALSAVLFLTMRRFPDDME